MGKVAQKTICTAQNIGVGGVGEEDHWIVGLDSLPREAGIQDLLGQDSSICLSVQLTALPTPVGRDDR